MSGFSPVKAIICVCVNRTQCLSDEAKQWENRQLWKSQHCQWWHKPDVLSCLILYSISFLQPFLVAVLPCLDLITLFVCMCWISSGRAAKLGRSNRANTRREGLCRMLALTSWNYRRLFIMTLTPGYGFPTTQRLFHWSRKFSRPDPAHSDSADRLFLSQQSGAIKFFWI